MGKCRKKCETLSIYDKKHYHLYINVHKGKVFTYFLISFFTVSKDLHSLIESGILFHSFIESCTNEDFNPFDLAVSLSKKKLEKRKKKSFFEFSLVNCFQHSVFF